MGLGSALRWSHDSLHASDQCQTWNDHQSAIDVASAASSSSYHARKEVRRLNASAFLSPSSFLFSSSFPNPDPQGVSSLGATYDGDYHSQPPGGSALMQLFAALGLPTGWKDLGMAPTMISAYGPKGGFPFPYGKAGPPLDPVHGKPYDFGYGPGRGYTAEGNGFGGDPVTGKGSPYARGGKYGDPGGNYPPLPPPAGGADGPMSGGGKVATMSPQAVASAMSAAAPGSPGACDGFPEGFVKYKENRHCYWGNARLQPTDFPGPSRPWPPPPPKRVKKSSEPEWKGYYLPEAPVSATWEVEGNMPGHEHS